MYVAHDVDQVNCITVYYIMHDLVLVLTLAWHYPPPLTRFTFFPAFIAASTIFAVMDTQCRCITFVCIILSSCLNLRYVVLQNIRLRKITKLSNCCYSGLKFSGLMHI